MLPGAGWPPDPVRRTPSGAVTELRPHTRLPGPRRQSRSDKATVLFPLHHPNYVQTETDLFSSPESGQVEPAGPAQGIDPQQLVEQALCDSVRIVLTVVNPVSIREGKNQQAQWSIVRPDGR